MTRVLLIEDDERLAARLQSQLERRGLDCRWERDAEAGLGALRDQAPELLLLDLNLPGQSGFELLEQLRREQPERGLPVIVLTARSLGNDKVRALDLGADDYLTKPFWIEELEARMRAVLRRVAGGPGSARVETEASTLRRVGGLVIDEAARSVCRGDRDLQLTRTEYELLLHMLRRAGRVVMREHLYVAVLQRQDQALDALQKHMSRLRAKLGEDAQVIETVRGVGYRVREVDDV
ncbi:response regulator transcription factor [Pseudenhygromyxa sp. WMMC2535]|uniref:response regulator transcription factor n=1 Tax=Pseudenhygromyxa sp. WMMC2535 TaxID=2712867 RepID=UPI0015581F5A|nr:response regulator transcription factor [Pseudenhygromyxa sp. WMMC2535]NVB41365.1 response regulator transcription factor [Pseudenhygromyxa sp. WMMC2535]